MLDKIVISKDRKEGRVYFNTHSVGFYHSKGKVVELIYEIVLEPSIRLEERYRIAEEKTVEIDLQLNFFDKEAA
jgi:hypothetical protein